MCRKEQNLRVRARRNVARGLHRRRNHQRCPWLRPARQIKEIIVLPESVDCVGALRFRRREQHSHAAIHFLGQGHPPRVIVRSRLTVERKQRRREHGTEEYSCAEEENYCRSVRSFMTAEYKPPALKLRVEPRLALIPHGAELAP